MKPGEFVEGLALDKGMENSYKLQVGRQSNTGCRQAGSCGRGKIWKHFSENYLD